MLHYVHLNTPMEKSVGLTKYASVPKDKVLVFDNLRDGSTFHSMGCPLPFQLICIDGEGKRVASYTIDKPVEKIRLPIGTRTVMECAVGNERFVGAQLRQNLQPMPPAPAPLDQPVMQAPELTQPEPMVEKPTKKKLPISDEFLPLTNEEWQDIWNVKNGKLTPAQAIAFAAENKLKVLMQYQKLPDTGDPEAGALKIYKLEPFSYRVKFVRGRGQRKKYFFGWDALDNTIKQFAVTNIKSVQILPEKYDSGKDAVWPVEIKWKPK